MEQVTLLNGFIAFLGMVLYFLYYYKTRKNKDENFDFVYWLKNNTLELAISFIVSLALFLAVEDLAVIMMNFIPTDVPMYKMTAFLCGLVGQAIVKKVLGYLK